MSLHNLAIDEFKKNKERVIREIDAFIEEVINYRNIALSDDLQLILRRGGSEKLLLIGFPFPLESYPLDLDIGDGVTILLFLRGEKIRAIQRENLIEEIKKIGKVDFIQIENQEEFENISKEVCSEYNKITYLDPYSFIGDSFIGTHVLKNFMKKYLLELREVYSENYKNLNVAFISKGYVNGIGLYSDTLYLFSDFIDNQWDRTKHLVKYLVKNNRSSIICGRNLIVKVVDKDNVRVYHYNKPDPLLKSQNIEDYMNECISPFFKPENTSCCVKRIVSNNLLINPFGSEELKNLPVDFVAAIIRHLNTNFPESKVIIVGGFKNSYNHLLWISKLRGVMLKEGLKNCIIKRYGSFDELSRDIEKYDISLGVTADTSIAHYLNFLGIRNLTLYNLLRCDLTSPQSMASDSPLGFCRYGEIQFPALIKTNNLNNLIKGTELFINHFFKSWDDNLSWSDYIYDSSLLISKISSESENLKNASKKLDPKYKLRK